MRFKKIKKIFKQIEFKIFTILLKYKNFNNNEIFFYSHN